MGNCCATKSKKPVALSGANPTARKPLMPEKSHKEIDFKKDIKSRNGDNSTNGSINNIDGTKSKQSRYTPNGDNNNEADLASSDLLSCNSGDIDERVVNSRLAKKKQDLIKSKGHHGGDGSLSARQEQLNMSASEIQRQKASQQAKKQETYLDIKPQEQNSLQQQMIYHITKDFPVSRPYSDSQEWQKLLFKHLQKVQNLTQSQVEFKAPPINPQEQQKMNEELVTSLLEMKNRNWIQEQIKLHGELNTTQQGSFPFLVKIRQSLQLSEHFQWFMWAIAQYYFVMSQKDQLSSPQSDSKQFNGNQQFSRAASGTSNVKLPSITSPKWSEGFLFKGVYIKLLPYEDAQFVLEEIKALKYVQLELKDLESIEQSLQSKLISTPQQKSQNGTDTSPALHKHLILPLLAGTSCGGFYLYCCPAIYTQDLDYNSQVLDPQKKKQTIVAFNNSEILPKMGSSVVSQYSNSSVLNQFSYLQQNIQPDLFNDPLLKAMPIVKNLTARNLVPMIDFEEFHQLEASRKSSSLQINYLVVYSSNCLKSLDSARTMFKIPNLLNEDIVHYAAPESGQIELNEIKQILFADTLNRPQGDADDNSPYVKQKQLEMSQFRATKRYLKKHNWDLVMIDKTSSSSDHSHNSLQPNAIKINENKRATNLLNQRENTNSKLGPKKQQLGIVTPRNPVSLPAPNTTSPMKPHENLKTSPDLKVESSVLHQSSQVLAEVTNDNYIKQTCLKRTDNNREDTIYGNVLIAAYNRKPLKIQYSLTAHSYSCSIEQMFAMSIEQVTKILNHSDKIMHGQALKDLLHRKGLNMRFAWAVLAKTRHQFSRDLVMTDILIRVIRKIVNEELKIKCKQTINQQAPTSLQVTEKHYSNNQNREFYQGNQADTFKEVLVFICNAVLKKKYCKYKQVFDEALLGLFLSRMKTLSLVHQFDLKQEELNYLESKDILEHIIETPARNPIMFINAVQSYFKIEFEINFLRQSRQDKFAMLNKQQPLVPGDIKSIEQRLDFHFTIKEQAYFILARVIFYHQKVKSQLKSSQPKASKKEIKQTFQKPKGRSPMMTETKPRPDAHNQSNLIQQESQKTTRDAGLMQNTPRNNTGMRKMPHNYDKQGGNDTHRNFENINKFIDAGSTSTFSKNVIDLSNMKRSNFNLSQTAEIILPCNLYRLHTIEQEFKDDKTTYADAQTVFNPYYEMPSVDVINEWVLILENMLPDVYSVHGSEQVLLEAFQYQAIQTFFFENDNDGMLKILQKIRDTMFQTQMCAPETIVMAQTLTGLYFDQIDEQFPLESEKSYLAALICLMQINGDPRGRGNYCIPFSLLFSWKLSLLALASNNKLHDSEFTEEIFDACLTSLFNHRRFYKNQQIDLAIARSQGNESGRRSHYLHFEQSQEQVEFSRNTFNIKKYKTRPVYQNQVATGGLGNYQTSQQHNKKVPFASTKPQAHPNQSHSKGNLLNMTNDISVDNHMQNSQYSFTPHNAEQNSILQMQKPNNLDADISDIDLEFRIEEDSCKAYLIRQNFKDGEWHLGRCPFSHWSINRHLIATHNKANMRERNLPKLQSQFIKEQLVKLDSEEFYHWLVSYNPIMYQSGANWDSKLIKDIVFCQNQQMVSSSGTSIVMSIKNLSEYSFRSSQQVEKKRKNVHLGSYSQILGKEIGGLQRQDMQGVAYVWGTDSSGQLGLDTYINSSIQSQIGGNLKVLYPRMLMGLKDELVKEVSCGYGHTIAITQYGQMYTWGNNDNGQLGLGDDVPECVRRPVLNPYLSSVSKAYAGNEHTVALNRVQDLYVWGSGGQLGLNKDQTNKTTPTKLLFFNNIKIQQIAVGGLHTMVLSKSGEVYVWGGIEGGQLGLPQSMINKLTNNNEHPLTIPTKIPKLDGIQIAQVACGEVHSIALAKSGTIYGWGLSLYGQLGLGFSGDSFAPGQGQSKSKVQEPMEITMLRNKNIKRVYCGSTFTLFLSENGELYGCGMNDLGQLGLDTFMEDMTLASMHRQNSNAMNNNNNNTTDVIRPTKVICFDKLNIQNVACGENHALAVIGEEKNMLWAWGMYRNGQLGLGEVTMKMNPRPVQTLCSSSIYKIACGSMHSVALLGDSSSLQTMSTNYFHNTDALTNSWFMDIKNLDTRIEEPNASKS